MLSCCFFASLPFIFLCLKDCFNVFGGNLITTYSAKHPISENSSWKHLKETQLKQNDTAGKKSFFPLVIIQNQI